MKNLRNIILARIKVFQNRYSKRIIRKPSNLRYRSYIGMLFFSLSISMTGCSVRDSGILMEFHGVDSGKNADIGIYGTAAFADMITSEVCAISPEDAQMEDEHISAKAALRIDQTNNQMVYASNIYEHVYPASTTKLMTALLLLKYGNLKDMYTFQEDNGGITLFGAKLCGFKKGDTVSLETLLNCLLVYSGNDAGVGIAEHMSGSEEAFVAWMNEEAKQIGATNTNFVNSHGLHDSNHYTTAYDMYLIFRECIQYDEFVKIIRQSSYTAEYTDISGELKRKSSLETTNYFLIGKTKAPEGVTVFGGKTGSTGSAGECLILLSEDQDHNRIITAVFDAPSWDSLYEQHAYLMGLNSAGIYE